MTVSGEPYPDPAGEQIDQQPSPAAALSAEIERRSLEMHELAGFFDQALAIVTDQQAVNEHLAIAGREDLALTRPVYIAPLDAVSAMLDSNNFTPNFAIYAGTRETGETVPFYGKQYEPIPATAHEILTLRELPKFESHEDLLQAVESGQYPGLSDAYNHTRRPAFVRLLNLFPEFTVRLAVDITHTPSYLRTSDSLQQRLFVAYNVMARLVEASDYDVAATGNNADYLTR